MTGNKQAISKMKNRYIIFLLVFIAVVGCKESKTIHERLQPVAKESGFRMDGYWVWGGSVIKVDSIYHMFASRWPKMRDFPYDYFEYSEIVRATSKSLEGPYEFQEVVIGERDSFYWDSNMSHNPTIHKIGNEYVLFYIGSDFSTMRVGEDKYFTRPGDDKYYKRRIGYAVSSSIEGPWKRSDKAIIEDESNNPAILVDDQGIKLLYRNLDLRVFLTQAESYEGPFKVINDNVWPGQRLEDFYMFRMDKRSHIICEDNVGSVSGHERWGIHLFSEDGVSNWKKYDPLVVYNHDILYDDGSVCHCNRRERPQLFIDDGKIMGLLTAVYDGNDSWCQPVRIEPAVEIETNK